jgi:hypothetical protein
MIEPEDEMLNLARSTPSRQTGAEPFTGLDAGSNLALLDFWQWAYSDLLSNTNRGRLAEFIVARAIGLGLTDVRTEWDAFDLVTSTGVKVEVKSAAYVQRWFQKKLSVICFDVSPRREWSDATNQMEAIPRRHADVYVFALLAHQDKASINPLDLGQWRFYVAPAATLGSRNSVTLKTLEALPSTSGPVTFAQLHEVVEHAALRREDVSNALRG